MIISTIQIVDEGAKRYSIKTNNDNIGKKFDNDAESVKILFPQFEIDNKSGCTMIIATCEKKQIDAFPVIHGQEVLVKDIISKYPQVKIGFTFQKLDGYTKNSSFKTFRFGDSLSPNVLVDTTPEQHRKYNLIYDNAFVDVKWKEDTPDTLVFSTITGKTTEIKLESVTQAQSDMAEQDTTSPAYILNKSTKYLLNDGDGTSPYVTQKQVTFDTLTFSPQDWEQYGDEKFRLIVTQAQHKCAEPYLANMRILNQEDSSYEGNIAMYKVLPNDSVVVLSDAPIFCKIIIKGNK